MREIQCSNVSVFLKCSAILGIRAVWTALGKWRNDWEHQYPVCGAPRMQCVHRTSGCQRSGPSSGAPGARSDSGIYWSFPETLWSVPTGAWAYATRACPSLEGPARPGVGAPPSPEAAPGGWPAAEPRGWVSRRWQRHPLGKAISGDLKQKSLKMLKRLRKRTLSICLTSLVGKLKLKGHVFFFFFFFLYPVCGDTEWNEC